MFSVTKMRLIPTNRLEISNFRSLCTFSVKKNRNLSMLSTLISMSNDLMKKNLCSNTRDAQPPAGQPPKQVFFAPKEIEKVNKELEKVKAEILVVIQKIVLYEEKIIDPKTARNKRGFFKERLRDAVIERSELRIKVDRLRAKKMILLQANIDDSTGAIFYSVGFNSVKNESDFSTMFPPHSRNMVCADKFLIINDPEITMTHAMIDSSIVADVDRVLTNGDTPSSRMKSFFAIVTGMGRGKTRTLVEMDREVNRRDKALSVAITFNHNWDLEDSEISKDLHPDYKVRYAITVVTRILSVYYRLKHSQIVQNVVQYLIKKASLQTEEDTAIFLIRDCLRYIVRQYRDGGNELDIFVLMLDESKRVEEKMKVADIHNTLRKALLDDPLFDGMKDQHVRLELIMSSLDIKSTGLSLSKRVIKPITTPEVLTPETVLDEWWLRFTPVKLTAESRFKLLKLISTMNSLSRALQYGAVNFGKMAKKHLSSNIPWDISPEEISLLYGSVREDVAELYPIMKKWHLSPRLTKALLFCEETVVDDEVMRVIMQGVFTNTLTDFPADNSATIFPKTCLLAMDIMSSVRNPNPVSEQVRNVVDSLLKFMVSNDSQFGYPLEIVANGIINARLLSLADIVPYNEIQTFTISQLLLLEDPMMLMLSNENECNSNQSTIDFLTSELKIARADKLFTKTSTSLRISYDEKCPQLVGLSYLKDANNVIYPRNNVVTKKLDPKEAHDGVWSFRTCFDMIYTLMIDAKGVRELHAATSYLPLDLKQAIYLQTFDEKIQKFTSNNLLNVNIGSMTHSLALNNAIFVYITTRREVSKISDRILIMGDTDTRIFLGFLEPLYGVTRTSSVAAVRDYNYFFK